MQNTHLLLGGQCARQPIETFIEAVAGCRTSRLDKPLTISKIVQSKLFRYLGGRHSIWEILFVSEHKHDSIPHLIFVDHLVELFPCVFNTVTVIAVTDID